ncbi:MAG TPA: SufS family cysteine desulfurase [Pirellulaceae bacterium]|nr:SufS family cysteine desulfurase [Pirellulaceae bacterium]
MPASTALDEIISDFEDLEPIERLGALEELGRYLPEFPESLRTEENRVLGCQSMVWFIAQERPGNPLTLEFQAYSDAPIVRGEIAVLLAAYSGRTPQEIVDFPIEELFGRLKLRSFLTPLRSNGLSSMVKRIQRLAAEQGGRVQGSGFRVQGSEDRGQETGDRGQETGVRGQETGDRGQETGVRDQESGVRSQESEPGLLSRSLRDDFPILTRVLEDGQPLAYLDNGATAQRPRVVIDAMVEAYQSYYSNVHRGGHALAVESTRHYEQARSSVARLLHARSTDEIIFTAGATAAINLVARSWGDANVRQGDEILLTQMEHHSNIVPWQQLAERTGCTIKWVPLTDGFELDLATLDELLTKRTRLMAVTAVSNVLGTINPISEIVARAHAAGAKVLVDAAQHVPHEPTDVQAWNADFVALSGHKLMGPSGVGVLYGRQELLEAMPPFLGGGSMIKTVTLDGFTPADLPYKFEAGTPMIVPAIGLGVAAEYLQKIGPENIAAHERVLTRCAHELLSEISGLRILGPAPEKKGGIVSFVLDRLHADDVSRVLDLAGIAVRAGHHCAMPLHARYGVPASCRASFYCYNTVEEVQRLAAALEQAKKVLHRE